MTWPIQCVRHLNESMHSTFSLITNHLVVGWINGTVFRGEERDALYTLQVGYIKGGSAIRKGKLKLKLQHTSDSAGTFLWHLKSDRMQARKYTMHPE